VAGPSSALQRVSSGGPRTTASHLRQCQLACPAAAVAKAGDMTEEARRAGAGPKSSLVISRSCPARAVTVVTPTVKNTRDWACYVGS
jgi:hypothetical protein